MWFIDFAHRSYGKLPQWIRARCKTQRQTPYLARHRRRRTAMNLHVPRKHVLEAASRRQAIGAPRKESDCISSHSEYTHIQCGRDERPHDIRCQAHANTESGRSEWHWNLPPGKIGITKQTRAQRVKWLARIAEMLCAPVFVSAVGQRRMDLVWKGRQNYVPDMPEPYGYVSNNSERDGTCGKATITYLFAWCNPYGMFFTYFIYSIFAENMGFGRTKRQSHIGLFYYCEWWGEKLQTEPLPFPILILLDRIPLYTFGGWNETQSLRYLGIASLSLQIWRQCNYLRQFHVFTSHVRYLHGTKKR